MNDADEMRSAGVFAIWSSKCLSITKQFKRSSNPFSPKAPSLLFSQFHWQTPDLWTPSLSTSFLFCTSSAKFHVFQRETLSHPETLSDERIRNTKRRREKSICHTPSLPPNPPRVRYCTLRSLHDALRCPPLSRLRQLVVALFPTLAHLRSHELSRAIKECFKT